MELKIGDSIEISGFGSARHRRYIVKKEKEGSICLKRLDREGMLVIKKLKKD